jgi:hypothetical protein
MNRRPAGDKSQESRSIWVTESGNRSTRQLFSLLSAAMSRNGHERTCAILMNERMTFMANVMTAGVEEGATRVTSDLTFRPRLSECAGPHRHAELFNDWFSRCRGALHFTACRVLGGPEGAELAVQKCWLRASRNPPTFDREGAFRSWLLRILIDEASTFLRHTATRANGL